MTKGIKRKIQLDNYGGNKYESADFWIEGEQMSFDELDKELNEHIISYIQRIPGQKSLFNKAVEDQEPF